jgi:DNA repair exonuclease SbcCD ATPase subunit
MAVLDSTITYPVALDAIEKLEAEYMPLAVGGIDDRKGLAAVKNARQDVKSKRVAVEKRRKELKAGALDYGRKVDSAARILTERLRPIEDHLQIEEKKIADEKARLKREAEEVTRRKIEERISKLDAVGCHIPTLQIEVMSDDEFETALNNALNEHQRKLDEAAEQKRLAEEEAKRQRLEAEKLAAERESLEAQRRELEEARQKADAEKRRIEEQQREIERQKELEKAKVAAAEQARQDEITRQKREAEEAERKRKAKEAERKRQEALKPDREKLLLVADRVMAIEIPDMSTDDGTKLMVRVRAALDEAAATIRGMVGEQNEHYRQNDDTDK